MGETDHTADIFSGLKGDDLTEKCACECCGRCAFPNNGKHANITQRDECGHIMQCMPLIDQGFGFGQQFWLILRHDIILLLQGNVAGERG